MAIETNQASGFVNLLDALSLGRVATGLTTRKKWFVVGASTGALLGMLASIWGPPRTAEATAVIREASSSEYTEIQIPEIFNISRHDILPRLQRELSKSAFLAAAIDSVRFRPGDLFTTIPSKTLNSSLIKLRLEPVIEKRVVTSDVGMTGSTESVVKFNLGITGTHPRLGAEILTRLAESAHAKAKSALVSDRKAAIELEIARANYFIAVSRNQSKSAVLLEQELRAVRLELKAKRESRIAILMEGVRVATAVGLDKPSPAIFSNDPTKGRSQQNFDTKNVPVFLLGSEALKEQIRVLQERRQDDHEDERVSEITRDLDILKNTPDGDALRVRGDAVSLDFTYLSNLRRLHLLKQIDTREPSFQLLDVEKSPSPGDYSDIGNMLWNILRGSMLGLVVAGFLTFGALVRFAGLQRAPGAA